MSVATVRLLAADPESYDRVNATGDGVTVEYRLPQSPVVANSQKVYVAGTEKTEGTHYTLDDEAGVVSFTAGNIPALGATVVVAYRHTLLSDASIAVLLTLEADDDRLAAAQALDVIASSEALISKKIKLLDLETDGPAVSRELRKHAAELRRQVAEGSGDFAGQFDVAELVVNDFAARERLAAEALRS